MIRHFPQQNFLEKIVINSVFISSYYREEDMMPRGPRVVCENSLFNITARGNNKRIIFRKEKDFAHFKTLLLKYKLKFDIKLYHYCLMRNHIHMILKTIEAASLAQAMHGLQLAYVRYFNTRYGHVGRLWQGRFHSKMIQDDSYLLTAGLYIERNPVRAGLIKHPNEYRWSSYNAYAYGTSDLLIEYDPHYLNLGIDKEEKQKIYRQIMEGYINAENDELHLSIV